MSETLLTDTPPADATPPADGASAPPADGAPVNGAVDGEQSPAGGAAGEGDQQPPAAPEVPESYEFTPPEGFEIDEPGLEGWRGMAREAGLSQAQFDAVTKQGLEYLNAQLGKQADTLHARQMGWRSEIMSDRDLTDGTGLRPDVSAGVARVISEYGGDDLKAALNDTGAGDHPAIVRLFAKLAKAMDLPKAPDTGRTTGKQPRDRSYEGIAARMPYKTQQAGA